MSETNCRFPGWPHQYFDNPVTARGPSGKWWACLECDAVERNKVGPVRDDPTSLTLDKFRAAAARLHGIIDGYEMARRPNPNTANTLKVGDLILPVEDTEDEITVRSVTITPADIEAEIRQYHADHDGDTAVRDHGTALRMAVLEGKVGPAGYRQIVATGGKVSVDGTPTVGETPGETNTRVAGDLVAQAVEQARRQITALFGIPADALDPPRSSGPTQTGRYAFEVDRAVGPDRSETRLLPPKGADDDHQ